MGTRFTASDLQKLGLVADKDGNYHKGNIATPKIKDPARKPREVLQPTILPAENNPGELVVKWAGKDLSLNKWYSSPHWTTRDKHKKEWTEFFKSCISGEWRFETYTLTMEYNSRLDPLNTVALLKLYEDVLRELEIIKDDTPEFCKGVHIIPNQFMKRKSYKITVK